MVFFQQGQLLCDVYNTCLSTLSNSAINYPGFMYVSFFSMLSTLCAILLYQLRPSLCLPVYPSVRPSNGIVSLHLFDIIGLALF